MSESKNSPIKRYTVRVRAAVPLRYATHTAPFDRAHPVASAALSADAEKAARDRSEANREDLFGGMV